MKYNINITEKKELEGIWEIVLQNFPEGTETSLEKSIEGYIENYGLPETSEHPELVGAALEDYIGKNGLSFEDIRTIIED
ncbi:hypothetical protein [Megasphaera elsdenii]|uniref:hypothetical protein n=1 Tax=Megasphaera elsdenii TaxID=907 RepID=UPI00242AFCAB|nr:hypothetical protein [Megasphaera elsdenii]